MTAGGAALWNLFLEDGARHASRLSQGLAPAAARPDPARLDALATDAYTVATLALLMGMHELSRLALAVERGIAEVAERRLPTLPPALAAGAEACAAAFRALANPDASGARVDDAPLVAARGNLEAGEHDGTAAPAPEASAADDRVWTPQVDDDMVDLFVEEATERLEGLSQKLLALEERPGDGELVREIFRDLHTVKGSSGMVGLAPMNRLAHAAEDLVGQVRDGVRKADRPAVDALLAAIDGLRKVLEVAVRRAAIDLDLTPLVARLRDPGAIEPPGALPAAPALAADSSGAAAAATPAKQTLRVDFEKLDLLMNLVGELVLSKAGLATGIQGLSSLGRELRSEQRSARRALGGDGRKAGEEATRRALTSLGEELGRVERVFQEVAHDLDTSSGRLDRVSSDLRDQVMKLRMVPIAGVFRKYHRTVRDLAHALGKSVRLELSGEETELDKLLVEQLDDPLMHLVRNAIDHGIEPPAERVAAGKPPEGVLRLSARHRGNQIFLTLSDDGAGIDPERVRRKAREKRLLSDEELASLDERGVLELIFRPGFSTAARVTDVSGRGVGMDVVREAIVTRLKGAVDVTSQVGHGTTFTLRLPLTLAIIQILLARAGGETFCVPLDQVTRTLTCAPSELHAVYDREVLAVGGRQVPVVRLRQALELEAHGDCSGEEQHVILVEVFGGLYGLVCDRLLGKQEIVIKSLGDVLEDVPCAAGATLLGDRCAIILDVPAVVQRALRTRAAAAGPPPGSREQATGGAPTGSARRGGGEGSQPPADDVAPRARILLVEDSDVVREALRRLLEGAGYAVTEARDGREGLERARAGSFDLISTDVTMPHMDGYELCRALRADPRHRDTPIVMVTSRGEKIDRVRGFDAGVDEYITKPHDRQELLRAVTRHLRGGRR